MTYRFLGKKKTLWIIISLVLMIPGIISLFVWKLPLGIDFRGGAVMEVRFDQPVEEGRLRETLTGYQQIESPQVSRTGDNMYLIKTLPLETENHNQTLEQLKTDFGNVQELQYENVGPSVSSDLTRKAVIAVVLASLAIILYLAYSFRGVTKPISPWRFGVVAVIALLHDLIISVGIFSILAHFLGYEIDASFITALLTIMGFSVHDTIVVFDRIRENVTLNRGTTSEAVDLERIADDSLTQTLNRSLATSLTVLFTLSALVLLGGESIQPFVVTLLIGITIGTYSSIFTATPLLVLWHNRTHGRSHR